MTEAPILVTERLELWRARATDREELHAVVSTGETARFLGKQLDKAAFFTRFLCGAGSWQLYGYGMFLLRLRGSAEIVGNCGVFHSVRGLGDDFDDQPEAGWILRHDQIGKGMAGEAMRAALEWFEREHGAQRMFCMIAPENKPSTRLAEKLGFVARREAELPEGDRVRLFERVPA
jgi:RimJ/RimL family protein N-acetyltransferase